jgi:hypothetical protein
VLFGTWSSNLKGSKTKPGIEGAKFDAGRACEVEFGFLLTRMVG